MKCDREIVFSYLEEDNTQRAYFRLMPLLTVSGDVQEEAARLWPDHGALRIVPDKNEQGYFKDRMRELGHFCIMDLTPFPPEANKIRTNKNYRPDKEEKNQYILYSDTVKEIPEHTFYQVLEGTAADVDALAKEAVTSVFMIRDGDTLLGPVKKSAPEAPQPAPEMTAMVYDIVCPDKVTRTILCSEPAKNGADEAPAADPVKDHEPAPQPEEEAPASEQSSLPIGKPLDILDQTKNFTETLESLNQPLSSNANLLAQPAAEETIISEPPPVLNGTPLIPSAAMKTSQARPKNKVQEVVANQLRVAKNDPPAEPLPAGAKLRTVKNPVEAACQQLSAAWQLPEAQQQLVDFVLSLPGMHARLTPAAAGNTPLQQAVTAHLNDLEAERLTALVQLDQAQSNLEAFRANAVNTARADAQKKLKALEDSIQQCTKRLNELHAQMNALAAQRDALQDEISALQNEKLPKAITDAYSRAKLMQPVQGTPLYLRPRAGECASVDVLADRFVQACKASGVPCQRNAAIAVLVLLTVSSRIGMVSPSPAAALTLTENIVGAMGWRSGYARHTHDDQRPVLEAMSADDTPAICLTTSASYPVFSGVTTVYLSHSLGHQTHRAAYTCDPWPILPVGALPFIPRLNDLGAPMCIASLASDENAYDLHALETLKPVLDVLQPLSGQAAEELKRFVNISARYMDSGLPAACDWAITLWLLNQAEGNPKVVNALKPLLTEYPISLSQL